jgi:hypothetical protein
MGTADWVASLHSSTLYCLGVMWAAHSSYVTSSLLQNVPGLLGHRPEGGKPPPSPLDNPTIGMCQGMCQGHGGWLCAELLLTALVAGLLSSRPWVWAAGR